MLGNNETEGVWNEAFVAHFVALRVCLRDWRIRWNAISGQLWAGQKQRCYVRTDGDMSR